MKSNEEFIAGIYEKAAVYTEEKETKIIKVTWVAKATRIAAMVAVCIGLAGAGALVLGGAQGHSDTPENLSENFGVAMLSDDGTEEAGAAMQFRRMPVAETVTFTGMVDSVDEEEKRIWVVLAFDETAPEQAAGSMVCIKWDMPGNIGDTVEAGRKLTATGVLSMYDTMGSEHYGCAELILTQMENLVIE